MIQTLNENRRAHRRVLVSNGATITHDGDQHCARILNISAGGAGLQMEVRLPDATEITVEIDDVGFIPARIVRQMEGGVGVKFEISVEKERLFVEQIARIVTRKRREQFHLVK
ncbi:MAG: PilZ domain-containing protein [Sneathiella sp.]|nr:PilZ domain-containing protein [Sneathiella sp.]